MARRVGISEARRRLPELVRSVAQGGGRVDITYRGKPQVALLRVSDVKDGRDGGGDPRLDPALRGEIRVPGGDLVGAIHALRQDQTFPRVRLLDSGWGAKRSPKRGKRRTRGGST